jgi:AcrR family transcriptional regulator
VGCAIEVIAEVGFAQASIRKIADRVGIATSAVHYAPRGSFVARVCI